MPGVPDRARSVWTGTSLDGLEVQCTAQDVVGIRLLGWENVLPLSVVRLVNTEQQRIRRQAPGTEAQ